MYSRIKLIQICLLDSIFIFHVYMKIIGLEEQIVKDGWGNLSSVVIYFMTIYLSM